MCSQGRYRDTRLAPMRDVKTFNKVSRLPITIMLARCVAMKMAF